MKINREEKTSYYYEGDKRIYDFDIHFEEDQDCSNGLIIITNKNDSKKYISFTPNEFIHVMNELIDLRNQIMSGSFKV